MKNLLEKVTAYSVEYLSSLKERRVAPSVNDLELLKKLDQPLQEKPLEAKEVIQELNEVGSRTVVANAGGRFFGFVIGGSLPAALAANWLAGTWDQNAGLAIASPFASHIEDVCSKWLVQLLPVAKESAAGFVTGVTTANFSAIVASRHAILKKQGWDVEANGLFNAPEIKVIVGEEVHGSLLKALSIAGLGHERLIKVPVDNQGRMKANVLPELDERTILCLQAGNVNTGSFDPAKEIIPLAKKKGAWVHVDGAFGLWAGASPEYKYLTEGYELADSWATDAHKWLNVPYDSGIVLLKNPDNLRAAMSMHGAYLDQAGDRIPYQYTPELSRKARGIEIWAALRSLGRNGVAELIESTCKHAKRFAEGLSNAGYTILNDVVINQVLVSFGEAETTNKIISEIQKDGTCWCGGTVWQGKTAMRISVSSWATTDEDVEKSLAAIIRIAKQKNG
ncbi:MAG: aminotransferase class V-fold PLP-dependent enzyme [Ignavibacteria bacterium]|nr:aminotransferase class V-fold PLP-dependent enzyme [Ignavibacteria bacterium]